jgi:hypothetical protein
MKAEALRYISGIEEVAQRNAAIETATASVTANP